MAGCLASGGFSLAQSYGDEVAPPPAVKFEEALEANLKSRGLGDQRFIAPEVMTAFYDVRKHDPYWVGFFGPRRKVDFLLEAFGDAWTHGLNPETYNLSAIKSLLGSKIPAEQARLELLISDGYIRYVRDITGMRPAVARLGIDPTHWVRPVTSMQSLSWLIDGTNLPAKLESLAPQGQVYNRFRDEYMRLAKLEAESSDAGLKLAPGTILRLGQAHDAIPALRERLGVAQPEIGRNVYDDALASAVIKFQRDNGLKPDGVIGTGTIAALGQSRAEKMRQLAMNMERMRWMPSYLGQKYVVVNLPSAMLWAVEDGKVAFEMPVIVGRPERATPTFRSDITGIRFNPDWTIPPTIKMKDILPRIQENVGFLQDRNITLTALQGGRRVTIDPYSVDWMNITRRELHSINMVQVPGDDNPLGQYRVLMPNGYNIYLHDTNHPELFDKPERALSSGCMRMKDPARMAEFILSDEAGWDSGRIQRTVQSGRRIDVSIAKPIPVYTVYYTAWLDTKGRIIYGQDIYGTDRKLYDILASINAVPRISGVLADKNVDGTQVFLAQP